MEALTTELQPDIQTSTTPFWKLYEQEYGYQNYEIKWAFLLIEKESAGLDISTARANNPDIFLRAEQYIERVERARANADLLGTMSRATIALANGDIDQYKILENAMSQTSPIDTANVRRRIAEQSAIDVDEITVESDSEILN